MKAYKMLRDDYRSRNGNEPPWRAGETRILGGLPLLCRRGYHGCRTWQNIFISDCLYGPIAAEVDLTGETISDETKVCALSCTLLRAIDVSRELRLFAADCAERALLRERDAGHEPDQRSWQAIWVARLYADGKANRTELAYAAKAAANAATYAAANANAYATYAAERRWQADHFAEMMIAAFTEKEIHNV